MGELAQQNRHCEMQLLQIQHSNESFVSKVQAAQRLMENELASLSESIGSFAQLSSSAKEASAYMASIQAELNKLNTWLFELESFVKPGMRDFHGAMEEQARQLKAALL